MQNRLARLLPLIAVLLLPLASCVTVPVKNISDPTEFARNLFKIVEEGGPKEWRTQLTGERQGRGPEYAEKHFEFWKKNLLEISKTFGKPVSEQLFRLQENRLEFEYDNKWYKLITVADEGGALKINQD